MVFTYMFVSLWLILSPPSFSFLPSSRLILSPPLSSLLLFRYWAPTDWTDYNYTITDNVIYHSGQKRAGLSEIEGGVVNCNTATSCMKVKKPIYNEIRKHGNINDSSHCLLYVIGCMCVL